MPPTIPHPVQVFTLAILLDLLFGEPPTVVHPVAWMGTVISSFRKRAPKQGRFWPLLAGMLFMLLGIGGLTMLGVLLSTAIAMTSQPWNVVAEAVCLKSTFSIRALVLAGRSVQRALLGGDILEARRLVSWHLVSRDTASLSPSQVAAATIESVAENTSDSIVAPLFFFAIAGLPGALVYRFINTCDAILGYQDAEREWLGKAAARIDDLANLIPARITAVLMIVSGLLVGCNPVRALNVWWQYHGATASPNAGHPMSAAAGILNVELEKVDIYCLGRGLKAPSDVDIQRATVLLLVSTALGWIGLGGFLIAWKLVDL